MGWSVDHDPLIVLHAKPTWQCDSLLVWCWAYTVKTWVQILVMSRKIAAILSRTLVVSFVISSVAHKTSTSATHPVAGSKTESDIMLNWPRYSRVGGWVSVTQQSTRWLRLRERITNDFIGLRSDQFQLAVQSRNKGSVLLVGCSLSIILHRRHCILFVWWILISSQQLVF